jgi:hypothetical protein
MSQTSNNRAIPSNAHGECIAQIDMSLPIGIEQPHKKSFTTCSTSASTCLLLLRLSVRLSILFFRLEVASSSQWENMMEQMSPTPAVSSAPMFVQVVLEVTILRDRMDMIVYYLKWIENLLCVFIVVVVYAVLMK